MIDLNSYRQRIGGFNNTHCKHSKRERRKRRSRRGKGYYEGVGENQTILNGNMFIIYYIFILYVFMVGLSFTIHCTAENCSSPCETGPGWVQPGGYGTINANRRLPLLSNVYIKVAYFVLFGFTCRRFINSNRHSEQYNSRHYFMPTLLFFGKRTSRVRHILSGLILAFLLLNFLLIGIVNPSLLIPGPPNLSVYYQNVQGLIPFSNLRETHPSLNQTKIFELNCYINKKRPAIIMLTETWLKKSILDREIIENPDYNIFRCDRSLTSHPPDPNNNSKYKKFGGGVLIATRSDVEATFKRVSVRKGVEMVAVEVAIDSTKFIFCNYYRVGTLGIENHSNFVESIPYFEIVC